MRKISLLAAERTLLIIRTSEDSEEQNLSAAQTVAFLIGESQALFIGTFPSKAIAGTQRGKGVGLGTGSSGGTWHPHVDHSNKRT